jgi:hypothetical protein
MPFRPVSPDPVLPEERELSYSRTVRALVGQYIEIPFRGPGWVYLGEFGSRRGVSYDSRRMEEEGMTFVFRAEEPGTYSLKFNRQDFVRDLILNDYVKVMVEAPPPDAGDAWSKPQSGPDRVYASPRWPLAGDPAGSAVPAAKGAASGGGTAPANPGIPATETGPVSAGSPAQTGQGMGNAPAQGQEAAAPVPPAPAETDWLRKAREEYEGGRIAAALGALDQFMHRFPAGSDEAYWLYGQALEANNEATRNIRLALEYYRRLVGEYPQSSRYDEARRRIAYLERFYFNIQ